ncbi:MAG: hypothetical protein M0P61_13700 [Ignavibacteriaceae bacterium]|nr:hypothetical protein [Ignavibacteriaceae bacterium]
MKYYHNKYRVESIRLKGWDYSTPWWYFVTIATKNHNEYFGKIISGEMKLNDVGKIAERCWRDIPKHYPKVELDYFVVMPNHLHGIVVITEHAEPDHDVEPCHGVVEPCHGKALQNEFGKPIKNSLSMIINHYKGGVKHLCKENKFTGFAWQPKFYDRIIRNEGELYAIRKYIADNPIKWDVEKNVPDNLEM